MGYRLTGSSDLYATSARRPHASINFVTAHDGFTLADLVSYNEKHNGPTARAISRGENDNRSWNHGAEGPTDDRADQRAARAASSAICWPRCLLSQGVPMLLGGDEIGRTQRGNNNAYCQDNEISWYDWENADRPLLAYTQGLIALQRRHPVFRRRRWFHGRRIHGEMVTDIGWFIPDGSPMSDENWNEASSRAMAIFLAGDDLGVDQRGKPITDSSFYLMLNAAADAVQFRLPAERWGRSWRLVLDTNDGLPPRVPDTAITASAGPVPTENLRAAQADIELAGRSMVLLERVA